MFKKLGLLNSFYLDLRSLALFRIGLGCILIYDLLDRAQYITLHYTNNGVLPINLLQNGLWKTGYFSLHTLSGSYQFQVILFAISGIAALSLLFGYKTTFSTFLCWLLTLSIQNRNPWILNHADVYLRMLLFWGMFLPLGRVFSMDSINTKKSIHFRHVSVASVCLIVQIMLVYIMTGLLKNSTEWLWNGTAIYYALNIDQLVKPLGHQLLNYPELLTILTHSVIIVELIFPFLFIIPGYINKFRTIAIITLVLFHIGIAFTMKLGIFVPVSLIALVTLIPSPLMDKSIAITSVSHWNSTGSALQSIRIPQSGMTDLENQPLNSLVKNYNFNKLKSGLLALLLGLVLLWNIVGLTSDKKNIPKDLRYIAYFLRLDQQWAMFAPSVLKKDGWFITKATLEDGSQTDLFHQNKIQWTKPKDMLAYYKSERWRKYFRNLYLSDRKKYYCALAGALKKRWDQTNTKAIHKFTYIYMLEVTPPPGKTISVKKKIGFNKDY